MMFVAHVRCILADGAPAEMQLRHNRLDALMNDILALVGDGASLSDVRAVRFDTLPPVAKEAWTDASTDSPPVGHA